MTGKVTATKDYRMAQLCGMSYEDYVHNRSKSEKQRGRGRAAPGEKTSLENWGPVQGQMALFEDTEGK